MSYEIKMNVSLNNSNLSKIIVKNEICCILNSNIWWWVFYYLKKAKHSERVTRFATKV